MDVHMFRDNAWKVLKYISNYSQNISQYDVAPNVEPGYLRSLLPDHAPMDGEPFDDILRDFDHHIMKGVLHWCHPHFHAYFPSGNSFPSILADMLSDMTGAIGFSWASCPSLTELEGIVLDWWAKALGLPNFYLSKQANPLSTGGGSIQGSASEAIFTAIMAARNYTIRQLKKGQENVHESVFLPRLVCYTSTEAHSCVEKGAIMAMVKIRVLEPDWDRGLKADTVLDAINADVAKGLVPFMVIATAGSTGTCAFDDIYEIGEVCAGKDIWFHVDAAYAGNSFVCPENRIPGLEFTNTFNTNGNKFMLLNFDCSALWAKNIKRLTKGFIINPTYLQHDNDKLLIDLRHFGIPLSRRFRALKPFFLFRTYGIEGLQAYVRNHQKLAKHFEKLVIADNRFEVMNYVSLGLVCFRLKGESENANINLLAKINGSRKIHLTPTKIRKQYSIRFCVVYEYAKVEDVDYAWQIIQKLATEVLGEMKTGKTVLMDQKFRRMSFTMEAREAKEANQNRQRLSDFATPILIPNSK